MSLPTISFCATGGLRGVYAHASDGDAHAYLANAVVLATGGIGRLYRYTTNPVEATGDGIAMAARAGAMLADMEFVQFHPTALADRRGPDAASQRSGSRRRRDTAQ